MKDTCKRGHVIAQRRPSGHCPECSRLSAMRYRHRLQANDRIVKAILAQQAQLGITTVPEIRL